MFIQKEPSRNKCVPDSETPCLLDGSHAVEVAVRYEHKPFFALSGVMNYMEDQWGGSLSTNMRNAEEQERKQGSSQAIDGDNPNPKRPNPNPNPNPSPNTDPRRSMVKMTSS